MQYYQYSNQYLTSQQNCYEISNSFRGSQASYQSGNDKKEPVQQYYNPFTSPQVRDRDYQIPQFGYKTPVAAQTQRDKYSETWIYNSHRNKTNYNGSGKPRENFVDVSPYTPKEVFIRDFFFKGKLERGDV